MRNPSKTRQRWVSTNDLWEIIDSINQNYKYTRREKKKVY